jgi:hypothetical protein|eukprot:COSAG06_NODE_9344_length_1925_cov_18.836802_2_plen_225_part_00
MTPAQFERQCRAIADCSARLLLPSAWVWTTGSGGAGAGGYLAQSFEWAPLPTAASVDDGDDVLLSWAGDSVDVSAEAEDEGTLPRDAAAGLVRTELHVVLSPVYGQPLLLFRLYDATSGALLPHADACALLERWLQQRQRPEPDPAPSSPAAGVGGPAVTQQEHPVLGTPFYALHGCETAGLMATLGHDEGSSSYVLGWLSLVGPLVGLKLPLELATAVVTEER